jgi:hypothetical protein
MTTKKPQPDTTTEDASDAVWGAKAIGDIIDRTPSQTRYLFARTSILDGAVKKVGHKTLVGSRRRLRDLMIPTT